MRPVRTRLALRKRMVIFHAPSSCLRNPSDIIVTGIAVIGKEWA
jgi:hypothetical protein